VVNIGIHPDLKLKTLHSSFRTVSCAADNPHNKQRLLPSHSIYFEGFMLEEHCVLCDVWTEM